MPVFPKEKAVNLGITLLFGAVFGSIYQIYKLDLGVDSFWNIRLLILIFSGALFFYVLRYLDSRLIYAISKNYSSGTDRGNLMTYLPLVLLLIYPWYSEFISSVWTGSFFSSFLAISVAMLLVLKTALVIKARKEASSLSERQRPASGRLSLCLIFGGFGIILFWFHQLTYVFAGCYTLPFSGAADIRYLPDNGETRLGFTRAASISRAVPFEQSCVTVAYKILHYSSEARAAFNSVPFLFSLRVTDEEGEVMLKEIRTIDALSDEARKWSEIKLNISGSPRKKVNFMMKMRPMVLKAKPRFFLGLLCHNPLDFSYFRDISVQAAWNEPEIVPRGSGRPDVFLISIDTLRPDRLGCYGYSENNTLAVDSLAKEGILYENAFSQSTWTLPSHLSLLTSRFPNELHLANILNSYRHMATESGPVDNPDVVLPDILKQNGYYCAAFTDGGFISAHFGFYKGFYIYNERYGEKGDSFQLARQWLTENKEKDAFLFIHTYLVHDYRGKCDRPRGLSKRAPDGEAPHPGFFPIIQVEPDIAPSSLQNTEASYDLRVKMMDADIREFLSFLRQNNMYENSLIIFTSDHGESFGEEHDNGQIRIYWHAKAPYESQIRVPLIIKPPAGKFASASRVVSEDITLLDVAPTALAILDIDIPTEFRGRPLPPIDRGGSGPPVRPVFASSHTPAIGCIRENGLKYICDLTSSHDQFYDLRNDPLERHNLAERQTPEMLEMKKRYLDFHEKMGRHGIAMGKAAETASPELAEQLKALGYLD